VESVGIFSPHDVVEKAMISLQNQCVDLLENLKESPESIIFLSGSTKEFSTVEHSYDVLFFGISATVGQVINNEIHARHFASSSSAKNTSATTTTTNKSNPLTFCAFKKFHPHESYYVLRLAFVEKTSISEVQTFLSQIVVEVGHLFEEIYKLMK
jgi:hypothetical protein